MLFIVRSPEISWGGICDRFFNYCLPVLGPAFSTAPLSLVQMMVRSLPTLSTFLRLPSALLHGTHPLHSPSHFLLRHSNNSSDRLHPSFSLPGRLSLSGQLAPFRHWLPQPPPGHHLLFRNERPTIHLRSSSRSGARSRDPSPTSRSTVQPHPCHRSLEIRHVAKVQTGQERHDRKGGQVGRCIPFARESDHERVAPPAS